MYLAIDFGGSKTLLAVFEKNGKLVDSQKFKTPPDYPAFISALEENIGKLKSKDAFELCVIGAPGRINYNNGNVEAFGSLTWTNVPLKKDVHRICKIPVFIENDANLAGLSEAQLIKQSYHKILYLTVSTGIGGILIVDGKILPEYAQMELGQMKFENDGKIDDWEDITSGKAMVKKYGKKASEIEDPGIWYAVAHHLGLGIWNINVCLTPDVIVLGGGVGAYFEKFADNLHEALVLYSTPLVPIPPLRKAIRAEEAVIYGCYELARQVDK